MEQPFGNVNDFFGKRPILLKPGEVVIGKNTQKILFIFEVDEVTWDGKVKVEPGTLKLKTKMLDKLDEKSIAENTKFIIADCRYPTKKEYQLYEKLGGV